MRVLDDFAEAVRNLLTDLWELDDNDTGADARRTIAGMFLPPAKVEAALLPIER